VEAVPAEREAPDRDDTDKLLDELFDENGKPKMDAPEAEKSIDAAEQNLSQNPTQAGQAQRTEKENLSEPRLEMQDTSPKKQPGDKKPASVKQFLRERTAQAAKQREENGAERVPKAQPEKQQKYNQHQQPKRAAKKKTKERG
jgi:hypothetical protein